MAVIMMAAVIAVICIAIMIGVWETGVIGFCVVFLYTLSVLALYDTLRTMSIVCV